MKAVKCPLRKVLRRGLDGSGAEVEVLECGHSMPAPQDMVGVTRAARRRCKACGKDHELVLPVDLSGGQVAIPPAGVERGDLLQGTGRHRVLVRVESIDAQVAQCTLVRSGKSKRIALAALAADYQVIRRASGTCWKSGCSEPVHTFEIDDYEGFPNGLCAGCARRPEAVGTFDRPTYVGRGQR